MKSILIKQNPSNRHNLEKEKYRKISDVYKQSKEKLPLIKKALSNEKDILEKTIIFGPTKPYNKEIVKFLSDLDARFIIYYGETKSENLSKYKKGLISVLLTCDKLREGVDLDVNVIILVSSDKAKLQNIQRIGRALRTHGNQNKIARIYDFIADDVDADDSRRIWLEGLSKIMVKGGK